MIEISPATTHDVVSFYFAIGVVVEHALPSRLRAWKAAKDGKIIAIGGTALHDNRTVAFTDLLPGVSRRDIVILAHQFMELIEELGHPVYALKDFSNTTLEHFGWAFDKQDKFGSWYRYG